MDYRKELNEEQYMAATHRDGPLLILAGAGSGKTRVLVYRISYLVQECGVSPYSILAITFTNKAAREMLERAEVMLDGNLNGMWISTFHSACGRILRACGEETGYGNNFSIYDDGETTTVIKNCLKKLNIDEKNLPVKLVKKIISDAKNRMETPEELSKGAFDYVTKNAAKVYAEYNQELLNNKAMDFDDMLLVTVKLFEQHPEILEHYSDRFKYIMVDEYQDTNVVQEKLITMLAAKHNNLCVVGDDDQSIYSFRGATVDNILGFEKKHKNCTVIKLEQNYRSTQTILDAANAVIRNNKTRKDKRLWTTKGAGDKIVRIQSYDSNDESYTVAREIKRLVDRAEFNYRDIAILYRVNAISQTVESALTNSSIPYRVYGGLKYFDRKEIKDLVSYMAVCTNLMDNVALKRIINVPRRGIGDTSVKRAEELAEEMKLPLFSVLLSADQYPELARVADKMKEFATKILEFIVKTDELSVPDSVKYILDNSGLKTEYEDGKNVEDKTKLENLEEFISVAKNYEHDKLELGEKTSFVDFLAQIALSTDADNTPDSDSVSLMSVHNAKGLEFPCVFIVAMEDEIFPSSQGIMEPGGIDEERRLCYVAITRAKKKLYILNSKERMLYGQTKRNLASRFLEEIPPELTEEPQKTSQRFYENKNSVKITGNSSKYGRESNIDFAPKLENKPVFGRQINSVKDIKKAEIIDLQPGLRVRHPKFGSGTVSKLEGEGDTQKVEIIFDEGGMKRLATKFANLAKED